MSTATESYLIPLSSCHRGLAPIVGGKAAALGQLMRFGLRCPDGFVLPTALFREQCLRLGIRDLIDTLDESSGEQQLEEIRARLVTAGLPDAITAEIQNRLSILNSDLLAVRSSATLEDSATASFAGAFQTQLGVRREIVIDAVKRCWASIFTASAGGYVSALKRQDRLSSSEIAMAVIIEQLIPAQSSGVVATSLPGRRGEMLIEAGFGLGAVVDGAGQHDKFFVDKRSRQVTRHTQHRQVNESVIEDGALKLRPVQPERQTQKKLEDGALAQVIEAALLLENNLGSAQSIEFAVDSRGVWITQARPLPRPTFNFFAIEQGLQGTW
jgi:phosphoenolpyruvate synthase/pyruvate phosphate dikinase